jgi:glutamate dehydrogenase
VNMCSVATKQNKSPNETRSFENPLVEFKSVLKEAIDVLKYHDEVFELLKESVRFLEVRIPVRMDNGQTKVFQGFRAQHKL